MQGVSDSPCSDIYCGTEGGSELETQALQNEGLRLQASYYTTFNTDLLHTAVPHFMSLGSTQDFGMTYLNSSKYCQ